MPAKALPSTAVRPELFPATRVNPVPSPNIKSPAAKKDIPKSATPAPTRTATALLSAAVPRAPAAAHANQAPLPNTRLISVIPDTNSMAAAAAPRQTAKTRVILYTVAPALLQTVKPVSAEPEPIIGLKAARFLWPFLLTEKAAYVRPTPS